MDTHCIKFFFKSTLLSGLFLLCIFICSSTAIATSLSQETDSLEYLLLATEGKEKLNVLEILIPLQLANDPKLALGRSQQALEIAREKGDYRMEAIALIHMGNATRLLLSDYEAALAYSEQALAICQLHSLKQEQILVLFSIGENYQDLGNSYKAIENYMQAQVIAESLGQFITTSETHNKIGLVYGSLGNERKAIEYHEKALAICLQHHHLKGVADSYFWLANARQQMNHLELAEQNHDSALTIRRQISDQPGIGYSLLSIGRIHLRKGQVAQAKNYIENGLQMFNDIDLPQGQAAAYNSLGMLYLHQKQFKEALPYLQTSLGIGEMQNDKKIMRDSYENLYACYSGLKDYEQALRYKDLFVAISDLIFGEESERRIAELQTRFEIAEKEREIETLKKDNELRELAMQKQESFRDSLITGMILLLIILLLIIYLYFINRRNTRQLQHTNSTIHQQNQELQALNATKDKFFSIISHDLKGPLNSLTAFSGILITHTNALSKEEIQMLATDFDKSLKNLLSLLENLLEWSRTQTGGIDIDPEALELSSLVKNNVDLMAKIAQNKEIEIITQVPSHLMAFAGKHQMNTVLRNLISNALKFTDKGGQVTIQASEWKDGIEVMVKDTGVGIQPEAMEKLFKIEHKHTTLGTAREKGTGLGLMLCKEFIEQSGGSLQAESQVGFGSTFRFTIPKAPFNAHQHAALEQNFN